MENQNVDKLEKKYYWELPKDFAQKWVKSLRSGDFKQGVGLLYSEGDNENTYCCLGVAGEICGIPKKFMLDVELFYRAKVISDHKSIPHILREDINNNNLVSILTALNDSISLIEYKRIKEKYPSLNISHQPYDFNDIADFIEENIKFV